MLVRELYISASQKIKKQIYKPSGFTGISKQSNCLFPFLLFFILIIFLEKRRFNINAHWKCGIQIVPKTIQRNWLDPADRMSCLGSDQEYLPLSFFGCFYPLVHIEDQDILFYISICLVVCRHLHVDMLGHTLL